MPIHLRPTGTLVCLPGMVQLSHILNQTRTSVPLCPKIKSMTIHSPRVPGTGWRWCRRPVPLYHVSGTFLPVYRPTLYPPIPTLAHSVRVPRPISGVLRFPVQIPRKSQYRWIQRTCWYCSVPPGFRGKALGRDPRDPGLAPTGRSGNRQGMRLRIACATLPVAQA